MAVKVKVRDRDLGWKKLRKIVKQKKAVEIGVRGESAYRSGNPIDNVTLAAVHEFGTTINQKDRTIVIPERSFIRETVDSNMSKYKVLTSRLGQKIYTLKIPYLKALEILGLKVQSDMRRSIQTGLEPDLKPSTKRKRKRSKRSGKYAGVMKPLLDTGQLKNSITYEVVR